MYWHEQYEKQKISALYWYRYHPAAAFNAVLTVLFKKRWFQRPFHAAARPAAVFYRLRIVYFRFVCGVGVSGLREAGRGPDPVGACGFYCHAVYRPAALFSAPFGDKRDLPSLWT